MQKNFGFLKIFGVSTQTRKIEPVQTFCGQGDQFFMTLCGHLLWTATNLFAH